MKLLCAITLVLAFAEARAQLANNNNNNSVAVFARVDPTGLGGNGTGIRGVTSTNLTQNTTVIVQGFFMAGGVDLQLNRQSPVATAASAAGTALVNSGPKGTLDYRGQLVAERMRLVQAIESKRRDRQWASAETAQVMAIERAIQQADRQITLRGSKILRPTFQKRFPQ